METVSITLQAGIRVHKSAWLNEVDWARLIGIKTPLAGRAGKGTLLIGTAIHSDIIEPECFKMQYFCAPELDFRTKDGKQALREFETEAITNNKIVLKKDDFEQVELMRDSALVYPLVAELLEKD